MNINILLKNKINFALCNSDAASGSRASACRLCRKQLTESAFSLCVCVRERVRERQSVSVSDAALFRL